jgi:polysaccharide pyruvyl transferase WcaK-like protein
MISVFGATFTNKGAEAMLYTLRLHTDENIMINVFADYDSDLLENVDNKEYTVIRNPKGFFEYIKLVMYSILFTIFGINRSKYKSNLAALRDSTTIIDLSGFALTDDFSKNSGTYRSVIFLIQAFISKIVFRKKYYIFPQAFGPYKRYFNYILSKIIIMLADKVFIRGKRSFENVKCKSKKCVQTSDFVFSKLFRKKYSVEREVEYENYILINPNSRIYHKEKKQNIIKYILFLEKTIKYYLDAGFNIVLTPNELRENEEDDLYICNLLADNINHKQVYVNNNLDLNYLMNLVGKSEFSIVSRFHLMIFSLIMTNPVIVLSWSDKYLDIMDEFNLGKYCLKNYDELFLLSDDILKNKKNISKKIESCLIGIEEKNNNSIYGEQDEI